MHVNSPFLCFLLEQGVIAGQVKVVICLNRQFLLCVKVQQNQGSNFR